MLLTIVGVGLIWQSGYLARPLGLIPVFASYSEATPNAPVSISVAELESGQVIHRSNPVVHSLPASANQEVKRVALPVVAVAETATEPRLVQDRPISKPHPYALRVAAYKRSSKWAVAAVEQLREAGQRAFLVPIAGRSADEAMVRLVVGGFPNWDAAYHEGQRMQGSGQLKEFTVAYLPYAAELDSFVEFERAGQAIAGLGDKNYFCYVQSRGGDTHRVLAGAFETDEEARIFLGKFDGARIVRR